VNEPNPPAASPEVPPAQASRRKAQKKVREKAPPQSERDDAASAESFNPIVGQKDVRRFEFLHGRPPVSASVTLVFSTLRKGLLEFPPERVPTTGELLWSGIRRMYEVDMGLHHTNVYIELPSSGDAFAFQADVDIRWRVRDPQRIVKDTIKDVREALAPGLTARLREITRRFPIEQAADAEDAANHALRVEPTGVRLGLEVEAYVRLTMDAPTMEHAANVRGVQRYRQIITAGDVDQFALMLSQNPKDSGAVLTALNDARDTDRRLTIDFVNKLIDSGAIDRWQIDEQVQGALTWLKESTDRVISPSDQPKAPPTLSPIPPALDPASGDGQGNGSTTTWTDNRGD
jgi:hypothetical protein